MYIFVCICIMSQYRMSPFWKSREELKSPRMQASGSKRHRHTRTHGLRVYFVGRMWRWRSTVAGDFWKNLGIQDGGQQSGTPCMKMYLGNRGGKVSFAITPLYRCLAIWCLLSSITNSLQTTDWAEMRSETKPCWALVLTLGKRVQHSNL